MSRNQDHGESTKNTATTDLLQRSNTKCAGYKEKSKIAPVIRAICIECALRSDNRNTDLCSTRDCAVNGARDIHPILLENEEGTDEDTGSILESNEAATRKLRLAELASCGAERYMVPILL